MFLRGDNPATAAADKMGDSDCEAEEKISVRPTDGNSSSKGYNKEGNALRKELGVIVYNFDKKDQVRLNV